MITWEAFRLVVDNIPGSQKAANYRVKLYWVYFATFILSSISSTANSFGRLYSVVVPKFCSFWSPSDLKKVV
jgi:hypothetical protein